MTCLLNAWYAAALSSAIEAGKLPVCRLLNQPMVIVRDEWGEFGKLQTS